MASWAQEFFQGEAETIETWRARSAILQRGTAGGEDPNGVQGQSPLSGGQAKSFEVFARLKKAQNAVQGDCL